MKSGSPTGETHGGISLVEEAIQVLRRAPAGTLAAFYVGALPFVFGLLYYWTDMSRGAYADRRVVGGAFLLAGLFVWMKTWHAIFCTRLYAWIGGENPPNSSLSRLWQLLVLQAAIQPWGILIKPIALLITLPYPFVRGFFEHLLIAPSDVSLRIRPSMQRAAAEARLWPGPNILSLLVLAGFSIFLAINVAALIIVGPSLYHIFLGEESTFTRSSYSFLNSTFLATTVAGAYLCLNPIVKAVFVLRKFYGASIQTGADLRLQLRQITKVGAFLVTVFLLTNGTLQAQETKPAPSIVTSQLDRQLDNVLQRAEYAWREPRDLDPTQDNGWTSQLGKKIGDTLRNWFRPLKKPLTDFFNKISDWLRNRNFGEEKENTSLAGWSQTIPWFLGVGIALLLGIIGWLIWKQPRRKILPAESITTPFVPDLTSENVAADQLPEEGWLALAREMLAKGEVRLALRAFYLATLTQLASRQWVVLARHKSNRDYEVELLRKGRSPQPGREAFSATRLIFERVWYGTAEATNEAIASLEKNLEKIRQC